MEVKLLIKLKQEQPLDWAIKSMYVFTYSIIRYATKIKHLSYRLRDLQVRIWERLVYQPPPLPRRTWLLWDFLT